jgi:hypothetical protein
MTLARNGTATTITVVRRKPEGLFGPGDKMRAIMPAIKPTTRIHRRPLMIATLSRST